MCTDTAERARAMMADVRTDPAVAGVPGSAETVVYVVALVGGAA